MESSNYNTATTSSWAGNAGYMPPALDDGDVARCLRFRALRTAKERQAIVALRRHAAFGVEQDLGLDLAPFEQTRDEVGLVTAVYRDALPIATLRVVPTGHRLTGAERLLDNNVFDASILGKGSWEVGRVIMEPEDRHPELLLQCLALMLDEVMQLEDVRHFHATTTLAMARLWRRVGMRTVMTTTGRAAPVTRWSTGRSMLSSPPCSSSIRRPRPACLSRILRDSSSARVRPATGCMPDASGHGWPLLQWPGRIQGETRG